MGKREKEEPFRAIFRNDSWAHLSNSINPDLAKHIEITLQSPPLEAFYEFLQRQEGKDSRREEKDSTNPDPEDGGVMVSDDEDAEISVDMSDEDAEENAKLEEQKKIEREQARKEKTERKTEEKAVSLREKMITELRAKTTLLDISIVYSLRSLHN